MMIPYQALFHTQPELTGIHIFGAKSYFKYTRTNQVNMNNSSQTGIFLGYISTMKHIYVLSDKTGKVQTATHKTFDEAHMSSLRKSLPHGSGTTTYWIQQFLTIAQDTTLTADTSHLKVKLISTHTKEPTCSTPTSVGLDLYCPSHVVIELNSISLIATDISIDPIP